MPKCFVAVLFALAWMPLQAQEYGCPDQPQWDAVPCSMHQAIQPENRGDFNLTFDRTARYYRQYTVRADEISIQLHIYNHFRDADWVAREVAQAWAAQPGALRKAALPLIIGVDAGSGDSPVYLDYTQARERAHIVEFPKEYVHEYANTLDWSFEELLTHELCHAVDNRKGGRLSEKWDWRQAVRKDGRYVSDYARASNREDFAESCAAYFLGRIGGGLTFDHQLHVARTMPGRKDYFSRLFSLQGNLD